MMSWLLEGDVADAGRGVFAERERADGTNRRMWLPRQRHPLLLAASERTVMMWFRLYRGPHFNSRAYSSVNRGMAGDWETKLGS
jgi:hypothetical protein